MTRWAALALTALVAGCAAAPKPKADEPTVGIAALVVGGEIMGSGLVLFPNASECERVISSPMPNLPDGLVAVCVPASAFRDVPKAPPEKM